MTILEIMKPDFDPKDTASYDYIVHITDEVGVLVANYFKRKYKKDGIMFVLVDDLNQHTIKPLEDCVVEYRPGVFSQIEVITNVGLMMLTDTAWCLVLAHPVMKKYIQIKRKEWCEDMVSTIDDMEKLYTDNPELTNELAVVLDDVDFWKQWKITLLLREYCKEELEKIKEEQK